MPVRLAADVQLIRWNADPVKTRLFVFAEKAVVDEGKANPPPATAEAPFLTNATPSLVEQDKAHAPFTVSAFVLLTN
jgi:hypothetical protein